jgi:hypothetical protein
MKFYINPSDHFNDSSIIARYDMLYWLETNISKAHRKQSGLHWRSGPGWCIGFTAGNGGKWVIPVVISNDMHATAFALKWS